MIARTSDSRDPLLQARLYWSQSRLHALQNDPQTASRYARRALAIIETTEHSAYSAQAHHLLACMELDRGNVEEALSLLRRAGELLDGEGHRLIRTRIQLGEAEALALEAAGGFSDLDPLEAGRCFLLVSQLRADAGDPARAIELCELAAELLSTVPNRFLIEAYGRLADLFQAEGRKDEALAVLKKAVQAQASAGRQLV